LPTSIIAGSMNSTSPEMPMFRDSGAEFCRKWFAGE
jgi:hypothetical protein